MVRRKVGSRGSGKAVIRVFCEGESEHPAGFPLSVRITQ